MNIPACCLSVPRIPSTSDDDPQLYTEHCLVGEFFSSLLVGRLEAEESYEARVMHADRLISALLIVLREADQLGDEALVRRALSLQDAYLRLQISGIEEMLNASSFRD